MNIFGNCEISVVIPAYNEAGNIKDLSSKLTEILNKINKNFEIIFVDDGSNDNSIEILRYLNKKDSRVKCLKLSRNFGHQLALFAGIDKAKGKVIITMDADLQHPPEIIPQMLARYNEGYDIVYTLRRKNKEEGIKKRLLAKAFYWILNKITKVKIEPGSADFRLMSRKAAEVFCQMRETHRFNRGLISWIGFKCAGISYDASKRGRGDPKYNFKKNIKLALDGIVSFSSFPLRAACYLGLSVAFLSLVYGGWLVLIKLLGQPIAPGWTQLIVTVIFFGGLQLFFIGVIGEYVSRIFEEVKKRPLYIITETIGID